MHGSLCTDQFVLIVHVSHLLVAGAICILQIVLTIIQLHPLYDDCFIVNDLLLARILVMELLCILVSADCYTPFVVLTSLMD